jgi:hypothetical protein
VAAGGPSPVHGRAGGGGGAGGGSGRGRRAVVVAARLGQVRYGRPVVLGARVVAAAGLVAVAQVVAPGDPAVPALGVGAVTWLVLTGRLDLAPGRRR